MKCRFEVGQQVQCVSNPWRPLVGGPEVRWVGPIASMFRPCQATFPEVIGLTFTAWPDRWYASEHFRPLTSRSTKTGMTILRKLVEPALTDA